MTQNNTNSGMEFDEDAARKAWTHNGPDNFTRLTNADVCVYGARWQHSQDKAALASLQREIDVARQDLNSIANIDKDKMGNLARAALKEMDEIRDARNNGEGK